MACVPHEVLLSGLAFPEGPAFAPDGSLWFVELKGGRLGHLRKGEHTPVDTGGGPNGIAITAGGRILFCDSGENAIREYHPDSGKLTVRTNRLQKEPLNMPNDLAITPDKEIIFTCPGQSRREPTGYVAKIGRDGEVSLIRDGMYFPNGLAFTPDGRQLVVAETYKHRLWIGEWREGQWLDPAPWVTVGGPIGPDGMAFAADGDLYVAVFDQQVIKTVSPGGKIIQEREMPGKRPTNCAFDPHGELGLVVTEAEKGLLLSIPLETRGAPLFQDDRYD